MPPALDFPAFTIFATEYPAYKLFELATAIVIFAALLVVVKRTRIGLVVQAALTHPGMVGMLGHNVDRVFMLVFGVGAGLAAVAGVIAGPALVTQSNMAASLGPLLFVVVVVGGLGSLGGAFVASLLIGLLQTFAVASNASLSGLFGGLTGTGLLTRCRHLDGDRGPDCADPALPAAGADADLQAARADGDAGIMSDLARCRRGSDVRGPAKGFVAGYGLWLAPPSCCCAADVFSSGCRSA